ncbi:hypothetical protein Tco_1311069 [Tanacetum coccineum]
MIEPEKQKKDQILVDEEIAQRLQEELQAELEEEENSEADGISRRYSSMIRMLQNIDREYLETLWKLVKTKHGNTRPEEAYERVLWGDLKWSTFYEISESAYLYAGREKVSTYTCNNHKNAQQEASN